MSNYVQELPERTFHEVVTGKKIDGSIVRPLIAGKSYLYKECDYYILKLTMLPRIKYFVKRNKDSMMKYTVYAKQYKNDGHVLFDEPVGCAFLNPELKTHLEIKFPLLGRSVFMSLFPSEEL